MSHRPLVHHLLHLDDCSESPTKALSKNPNGRPIGHQAIVMISLPRMRLPLQSVPRLGSYRAGLTRSGKREITTVCPPAYPNIGTYNETGSFDFPLRSPSPPKQLSFPSFQNGSLTTLNGFTTVTMRGVRMKGLPRRRNRRRASSRGTYGH